MMHQFSMSVFRTQGRLSKSLPIIKPLFSSKASKRPGSLFCKSSTSGGPSENKPDMKSQSPDNVAVADEKIEVVPLEKAGNKAWAGVASIDNGESELPDWMQTSTLLAGDGLSLLLFAAIGRTNHGEVLNWETVGTALPFIIGWYATALLVDGYGPGAKNGEVLKAAATAGKCWLIGVPIGLGIRSTYLGYQPPVVFVAVSMGVIGVLMVGWRSAYAYATSSKRTTSSGKSGSGNKKGNPFDFLKLLYNLTQRW